MGQMLSRHSTIIQFLPHRGPNLSLTLSHFLSGTARKENPHIAENGPDFENT